MSLALLAISAASVVPSCSWDHPGQHKYTGDVPAALDRYPEIPAEIRRRLKARMERHDYDDVVTIKRDAIVGRGTYEPQLRSMQFGSGTMCREVSRARWEPAHEEQGMVYCEDAHCVVVPSVCRNVSLIQRLQAPPPAVIVPPVAVVPPEEELPFEPPGAIAPPGAAVPPLLTAGPADTFEGGMPPPLGFPPTFDWFPGFAAFWPLMPGVPFQQNVTPPPTLAVPETGAWQLLLAGLAALAARRGWRRWSRGAPRNEDLAPRPDGVSGLP
jgi:hypothetical protein